MNLAKQVLQGDYSRLFFHKQGRVRMLLNHSRTDAQALVKEPALIRLAESGQVTGKVLRLRLMVTVFVIGYPHVLHVSTWFSF